MEKRTTGAGIGNGRRLLFQKRLGKMSPEFLDVPRIPQKRLGKMSPEFLQNSPV
jgi:hypothetical protein